MDGDNTPQENDTDSDEGGPKSPRRQPARAPPYFAALQQQEAPEVPASWSHRPLGPNPGMPRVRPQQPPPMYADVAGSASGSATALTFGPPGLAGDAAAAAARSHRARPHHHRAKDGAAAAPATAGPATRQRAALSFGSPKLPSSPLASVQGGIAAMSLLDDPDVADDSSSSDVRARPRNLQDDLAALDQNDADGKSLQ